MYEDRQPKRKHTVRIVEPGRTYKKSDVTRGLTYEERQRLKIEKEKMDMYREQQARDRERIQREREDFERRGRREDKEIVQERISLRAEERAELETDYINRMRSRERLKGIVSGVSGFGSRAGDIRARFKRLSDSFGRIKTDPFKNINIMRSFDGGFGSRLDKSIRMPNPRIDRMYKFGNLESLYTDPFKKSRKRGKKKYKKKKRF